MTDLIKFAGGAVADVSALDASLSRALDKAPKVSNGTPYLKLSQKDGSWAFGAEGTGAEEGSLWAINVGSLQHGYSCWSDPKVTRKKSELLGEIFRPADEDLPAIAELVDHSDQGGVWKDAVMFDLACVTGEDQGENVTYSASSQGGCRAYGAILTAVQNRPEAGHFIPIVELNSSSYESNFGDTIFNPVFEVVDWATPEGDMLDGNDPENAADEEPEDEQPQRRRRRKAS